MKEIIALIVLNLALAAAVFIGVCMAAMLAITRKEKNETDDWD